MSKTSMIYRNLKRKSMINKFMDKRLELKKRINDPNLGFAEKIVLIQKLNSMPRNSSPVRYRKRCQLTGRGRGVYSDFGICRHKIREFAMLGYLPFVEVASW